MTTRIYSRLTLGTPSGGALVSGDVNEVADPISGVTIRKASVVSTIRERAKSAFNRPALIQAPPWSSLRSTTVVNISTGTNATTTATITTATPHYQASGESIVVIGCTPAAYNGTFTITAVTATTLTYVMGSDPGGPITTPGSLTRNSNAARLKDVVSLSNGQLIICTTAGNVSLDPAGPGGAFVPTAEFTDGTAKWWALGRVSQTPPLGRAVPSVVDVAGNTGLTAYNFFESKTRFLEPLTPSAQIISPAGSGPTSAQSRSYLYLDGGSVDNGFGTVGFSGLNRSIIFDSDSDVVEIGYVGSSGTERIRVYVDEYPVQEAPLLLCNLGGSVGSSRFLRISFAEGRKFRRWRIEAPGVLVLKYAAVTFGATLLPPPTRPGLTAVWNSDSFGDTVSPMVNFVPEENLATRALKRVGFEHVLDAHIGGSGYVHVGSSSRYNCVNLISNNSFAFGNPILWVFGYGINDGGAGSGVTDPQTVANARAAWALARAQAPNALIHVLGPWSSSVSALSTIVSCDAAMQAAFLAWNDPLSSWESPITGTVILGGVTYTGLEAWTDGTGIQGAPSGNGRSNIYTSASPDGIHPSPTGKAYYEGRIAFSLERALTFYGA